MDDPDLCWRAEAACRDACPAARTIAVPGAAPGWLIRVSGGPTRRINSVNPSRSAGYDPAPVLERARRTYRDAGRRLVFRVPSIAPGLDAALAREGLGTPEAETATLHAPLSGARLAGDATLSTVPGADRTRARAALSATDAASSATYEAMLARVPAPVRFALVRDADGVAAVAYGAISRGLLVIESVVTAAAARRRGHGRAVVAALMNWAAGSGAEGACLQVACDNVPALALYRGLGFARELYRYHYRSDPV